jgi:hypothetical protein
VCRGLSVLVRSLKIVLQHVPGEQIGKSQVQNTPYQNSDSDNPEIIEQDYEDDSNTQQSPAQVPLDLIRYVFERFLVAPDPSNDTADKVIVEEVIRMAVKVLIAGIHQIRHDARLKKTVDDEHRSPHGLMQQPDKEDIPNNAKSRI